MEGDDIIQLPTCDFDSGSDRIETCNMSIDHVPMDENIGQSVDVSELEEGQLVNGHAIGNYSNSEDKIDCIEKSETEIQNDVTHHSEAGCVNDAEVEEGQLTLDMNVGEVVATKDAKFCEIATETEGKVADMPSVNGCMTEIDVEITKSYHKGTKRMRTSSDEEQPSVLVKYYGLSRQSKRKLEELLRDWSEWTARHCPESQDKDEEAESGEEIYYPALDIGMGKASAVSFWMENGIRKSEYKDFTPVEDDSVPLYDRGFALGLASADGSSNHEGGLELMEAPRCFNCGSYNHSLKGCPKPRNNAAVNNSRKQFNSKRNQAPGARNVTRYYQGSPGGKYEGLRPGALDVETKQLLGLGEFDPPPWLNRMRELGYPPGYMVPEDDNIPSGITIFAEEETQEKEDKEDGEDGEILEPGVVIERPKKTSVLFPGINAPIPQNADERLWAARPSNSDRHRNGNNGCSSHFSENGGRGRYREHNNTRDFRDEESPLRYQSRYDNYEYGYTPRGSRDALRSGSPSPRTRNGPLDSEDSAAYSLYSSFSYSATRRFSEHGSGSDQPDYASRSRDRDDRFRHRSGR